MQEPTITEIYDEQEEESYRDHISTVDESGKRVWLYPKKPKGRFTNYRQLVSYLLLGILFAGPFIKIEGQPLLKFDIIDVIGIIVSICSSANAWVSPRICKAACITCSSFRLIIFNMCLDSISSIRADSF